MYLFNLLILRFDKIEDQTYSSCKLINFPNQHGIDPSNWFDLIFLFRFFVSLYNMMSCMKRKKELNEES